MDFLVKHAFDLAWFCDRRKKLSCKATRCNKNFGASWRLHCSVDDPRRYPCKGYNCITSSAFTSLLKVHVLLLMDILDDIFSESTGATVPVASKFKPKAKPRPKKAPSKPAPSIVVNATDEQPATTDPSFSVQPDVSVKEKPEAPTSSSLTETTDPSFSVQPDVSVKEKPEAPANSSVTKTNDTIGLSPTATELDETPALDVSSIQDEKEIPDFPDVPLDSSQTAHDILMTSTHEASEDFQINMEQLADGDFSCLDALEMRDDAGVASGKRTSKLKPKPARDRTQDMVEVVLPDDQSVIDDSVHARGPTSVLNSSQFGLDGSFSMNPMADQSQNTVFENTESLIAPDMLEQRGIHGISNGWNSPSNALDEEPMFSGATENTCASVDGANDGFDVNTRSPTKGHDESASNVEKNDNGDHLEEGKSKKKRGRPPKKVNGEPTADGNENDNGDHLEDKSKKKRGRPPKKAHDESASNREENDNVEIEVEKSKKRGKRVKDAVSENDKPVGKRKKASQEPDQSIDKPPKKFPRGTRRKRCVDKTLLEVPEEELDLHRLPIKDLILLAEYKERESKKRVASGQPVPTNERTENLESEGFPYYDDALEFDQNRDLSENPSTSGVQTDTGYYNYNTYRKVQPRAKWSKKDTDMFYQGIQQFGTDLSMIQQLFPGRSLEQIRKKYKKEEKENPMMMHDAQTTRATDNSCFELVIKTLAAAREAEKEYASSDDDLVLPTHKEGSPEENLETHATSQEAANNETSQKAANSAHNLEDEVANKVPNKPEDESPARTYNDDDDGDDNWDDYTGL